MGKYKIEVVYTVTRIKVFEVEDAANRQEAIAKAEEAAANFDFHQVTGSGEYEGSVREAPDDEDLNEGDDCPNCGGTIIDGPNNLECPSCGKMY